MKSDMDYVLFLNLQISVGVNKFASLGEIELFGVRVGEPHEVGTQRILNCDLAFEWDRNDN